MREQGPRKTEEKCVMIRDAKRRGKKERMEEEKSLARNYSRFLRWYLNRGNLGEDIGIRELDHVINCRPSIGRSPPPLSFDLPVKIIIRKAISHTEFVKNAHVFPPVNLAANLDWKSNKFSELGKVGS